MFTKIVGSDLWFQHPSPSAQSVWSWLPLTVFFLQRGTSAHKPSISGRVGSDYLARGLESNKAFCNLGSQSSIAKAFFVTEDEVDDWRDECSLKFLVNVQLVTGEMSKISTPKDRGKY